MNPPGLIAGRGLQCRVCRPGPVRGVSRLHFPLPRWIARMPD